MKVPAICTNHHRCEDYHFDYFDIVNDYDDIDIVNLTMMIMIDDDDDNDHQKCFNTYF